jgi:cell pole-organizing protein PopZ
MVDTARVARSILLRCGALFWPTKANTGRYVVHVLAPSMRAKVPAGQSVQELADVPEYVPAEQSVQELADVPEYVPAEQSVQELADVPEYVPAEQSVQELADVSEYVPAGQSVQELADVSEYVPAGQDWHVVSVSPRKNVPRGQQTMTPVGRHCLTSPAEHVPVHGTNTSGVPVLYRAMASASDIA